MVVAEWVAPVAVAVLVVAAVLMVVFSVAWAVRRSATVLERWAAGNGLTVLHREFRWFSRGPFWWRCSRGQTVYYVIARDDQGRVRHAFVRCGSWWWGLSSDAVAVEWVD